MDNELSNITMTFVRIFRSILREFETTSSRRHTEDILKDLYDLIHDNLEDIINPLELKETLMKFLEKQFIKWYEMGYDEVTEYYHSFFGRPFPFWSYSEYDLSEICPPAA